jgi:long-chain acyl-CoA synthetase
MADSRAEDGAAERTADRAANLGYFCHRPARAHPERLAVIDLHGQRERHFTYGQIDEAMDRVAAALTARGLTPGERVVLSVGNRLEFVTAMYGMMRAGLVPVPINTRQGADTIAYIIADSQARGAIVEPAANREMARLADAAGLAMRLALGDVPPGWEDFEAATAAARLPFAPPRLAPHHWSFLPYTSGSTGRPKGVVLDHAGQLWWIGMLLKYWRPAEDARVLTAMPLYHKNAMAGAIKPMLSAGGSVVLMERFEPVAFIEALARYRVTRSGGVPAAFSMLLRHRDLIRSLDLSALEALVIGSAPVTAELAAQIEEAFGCAVSESYGLTEGGPVMLGPPLDGRRVPRGSAGAPWPEGEVKLVGPDGREHASDGELWVRNPGVALGYYGLPEINAQRLQDGWLRTGDLFHRDAGGFYFFRGRTDDMFTCGGENVYPKEVENLLLAHPDVVDACVVPVEHSVKGMVPVALVMLRAEGAATPDALKAWTLERGPAYAHPRVIEIVEAIPLNGAGKNDRAAVAREMRARYAPLGAA